MASAWQVQVQMVQAYHRPLQQGPQRAFCLMMMPTRTTAMTIQTMVLSWGKSWDQQQQQELGQFHLLACQGLHQPQAQLLHPW
jgi:hypothetical protein